MKKGYDGLVHIELATPYLQQQVNRHGNVKVMVRVKCWAINSYNLLVKLIPCCQLGLYSGGLFCKCYYDKIVTDNVY